MSKPLPEATDSGPGTFAVVVVKRQFQLLKGIVAENEQHAASRALGRLKDGKWQDCDEDPVVEVVRGAAQ